MGSGTAMLKGSPQGDPFNNGENTSGMERLTTARCLELITDTQIHTILVLAVIIVLVLVIGF